MELSDTVVTHSLHTGQPRSKQLLWFDELNVKSDCVGIAWSTETGLSDFSEAVADSYDTLTGAGPAGQEDDNA